MLKIMDGCEAATYVAYALSDVGTIYPITPIAEMGQLAQRWGLIEGRRNLMGQTMDVREMESELGAAGATHGAAAAGALATTFTCSQGLLLMIPNMYKIAGEQLPAVFHVGTRSIASHALSIFGDHQDVMACRATGFAFLASATVQETMDLALVAHLAAIDGSLPIVHFMDGWRTSNEYATIDTIPYETMATLVNWDKVKAIRKRGLNPERPIARGSAQNPGVYFQNREACNPLYNDFPAIVQNAMDRVGKAIGRSYHLVDYYGAPDAERVIVVMGSAAEVCKEALNHKEGEKVGVIQVRLFQPFPTKQLIDALPKAVKRIAVLDRTKEPGAIAEPLCLSVTAAVHRSGQDIKVIGGRYGLSSKNFDSSMAWAVWDYLNQAEPKDEFTVGIDDDVTHLSIPIQPLPITTPETYNAVFYGMGADGTVGGVKLAAHIASQSAGLYAQAYFNYSAKKSGGYTLSQLRLGHHPISTLYDIERAHLVSCNKATYIYRFDVLSTLLPEGIFLLNCPWDLDTLRYKLPNAMKKRLKELNAKMYTIDADAISMAVGLDVRINMVMITAFLNLCNVLNLNKCREELLTLVRKTYMHEGGTVVDSNIKAIEEAISALKEIDVDSLAPNLPQSLPQPESISNGMPPTSEATIEFVDKVARNCFELLGDKLPVSAFAPDGEEPPGTTAFEKRRIAQKVPVWDPQKCVTCTECSLVCAHAAIRPILMDEAEAAAAPFESITPKDGLQGYRFRIQVFAEDCTGCGSCANICPGHALDMQPAQPQWEEQRPNVDYACKHVSWKGGIEERFSVRGSQLYQPLLQFSGACGGCGETPYVKLLTQLFGERMIIANATGCSSIWGLSYPSNPYCCNAQGQGPAWANSLFEDNAEYGYGMAVAVEQQRSRLKQCAQYIASSPDSASQIAEAAKDWIASYDDPEAGRLLGNRLTEMISKSGSNLSAEEKAIVDNSDLLGSKSIWAIGGDGWAYDIGYAGLDHVLATNQNINVLVLDNECYSNTGGQTSKATPLGAVAKYSPLGKRALKKDLARILTAYTHIYVAQVALGANYDQTIRAFREAESYNGPSIVVAYCPCIEHGIRKGMGDSIIEERKAVMCGYWNLFRYDPRRLAQGLDPFQEDAPAPLAADFAPFLDGEDRYADLKMLDPAEAELLRPALRKHLYSIYRLTDLRSRQS